MQRQIAPKGAERSLHAWRAFALGSSLLAIALAWHGRPAANAAQLLIPAPGIAAPSDSSTLDSAPSFSGARAAETAASTTASELEASRLARRFSDARESELSELAQALAQVGGIEAYAALVRAAQSTRVSAREAARVAIASLDTQEARSFMLEELSGPDNAEAVTYFTDCEDTRAIPRLEELARDSVTDARRTAIAALFAQGESARPAIVRLLQGDVEVSDDVLETPAPSAGLRAEQRTTGILRLRAGAVTSGHVFDFLARDASADARRALLLSARDPASAESAINALATRGDSATLSALGELAEDSDPQLAGRAACALLTAPDSRSVPFLLRAERTSPGEAATALLHIDSPEAQASFARRRALEDAAKRRNIAAVSMPHAELDFGS